MSDNATAFPLSWPRGKKRTDSHRRIKGPFTTGRDGFEQRGKQRITIAGAVDRLTRELSLLRARNIIISTNLELRKTDGLPKSGQQRMREDPGAAVYFRLDGDPVTFAVDKFDDVAQNLAAIAAHIGASRGIERWGVGTMRQIFQGYLALQAPEAINDWRVLLNEPSTVKEAEAAYYDAARTAHPDMGGSDAQMAALNAAIAKAREVLR
ncbi:MAG: hypothetical protein JWO85_3663 [Candidatus Eremiobacteraeota bacterium]|nr:hypothetical protein [Candidatus Eremiobacteraeota bacterium]